MWSPFVSSRSLATRGIAALIFGIIALLLPAQVLFGLIVLFGAYALVSGIVALVAGLKKNVDGRGWLLAEGVIGILIGVITLVRPGVTAVGLTYLIGAWALVTGVLQMAEAFVLRKYMQGEWRYLLAGVVSVAIGLLILARPFAGALAIPVVLGIYGLVFGVSSLMASRAVGKLEKALAEREERRAA